MINKNSGLMKGWRKNRAYLSKIKGSIGERAFVQQAEFKGKKAIRTGVGSDYKIGKDYYEIKTGSSKLSRKQKATKKAKGKRFHEVRYLFKV